MVANILRCHILSSGSGELQVDLFKSTLNRKCNKFCSIWGLDKGSLSNAFLLSWTGTLMYAFPPTPEIHRVLLKIKKDKANVILIAPGWPWQHWFSTLLERSITPSPPLELPH